jgi:hypothetical protein
MDIVAEKKWIHQEIDKVNDTLFVKKLKHLLEFANSNNLDSIHEYNQDIDNALENIKNGKFCSQDDAKLISKKWGRE